MISKLKAILKFIKMIGKFLVSMVTSLFTLFKYFGKASEIIVGSLGLFPTVMVTVVMAGVSTCIILMIVGRKT